MLKLMVDQFYCVTIIYCSFEKSIIFMCYHYLLLLIGILGFLAASGGVCGICPIPNLTLVVLTILKLTDKWRLSIIVWETCFEVCGCRLVLRQKFRLLKSRRLINLLFSTCNILLLTIRQMRIRSDVLWSLRRVIMCGPC